MSQRVTELRGAVLTCDAAGEAQLLDDAVIELRDGRVARVTAPTASSPPPSDQLFLPGFVDLHCHWPQSHVRGAFSGALLPWLREHIWPAEAAFADSTHARSYAERFLSDLHRAGTTSGLLFGPPFVSASELLLAEAPLGFFDGPALMERNCPEALQTPVATAVAEMANLPEATLRRWVVSPRFAPNVSDEGLRAAGGFAVERDLFVQSHLSENVDEVRWVQELFPSYASYTAVYAELGLLGPKTIMAHGIHLSDQELTTLAETETLIAHCPTSNEALGSGRMPVERLRDAGVDWVLATDVGAGPQLSQLHTMAACLAQHRDAGVSMTAAEVFARATWRPGQWLARADDKLSGLGTLVAGAPGHVVAFSRPDADGAEATIEALLNSHQTGYERAPLAVWSWGARLEL